MTNVEVKRSNGFKCKFCNREFKSVKTLGNHTCEQKRRYMGQDEKYVQLGFRAFQRFHYLHSTAVKPKDKTFDEFRKSTFYLGFTKFGKFSQGVNCLNYENFVDWLIKHEVKLDDWAKDSAYELYVRDYIKRESADVALERSIKFMQRWAESDKQQWYHFFREVNPNLFTYWIKTGRVSPWVVFNCQSGTSMLGQLNDEQMLLIADALDPGTWSNKFQSDPSEVAFVQKVLAEAGL